MNGYRSDSHSPCDTPVTSKESLGSTQSCDEDDVGLDDDNRSEGDEGDDSLDARPSNSPVAPLSLTTHKANKRSSSLSPVSKINPSCIRYYVVFFTFVLFFKIEKIKQEPPDKERPLSRASPMHKAKVNSPNDRADSESEDEVDDEMSETESIHKSNSDERTTLFSSPSPLLIPRSVGNSVFPLVPNSMFNPNFPIFPPYIQNMSMSMSMSRSAPHSAPQTHTNNHNNFVDDKRKRNRTFIDPVSEVPCLEKWFHMNTHPSHGLIMQYTEDLNNMAYRQKFPKLEPKNVQFWFKNRRAKCKRLKSSLYENIGNNNLSPQEQHYHQIAAALAGENYRIPE